MTGPSSLTAWERSTVNPLLKPNVRRVRKDYQAPLVHLAKARKLPREVHRSATMSSHSSFMIPSREAKGLTWYRWEERTVSCRKKVKVQRQTQAAILMDTRVTRVVRLSPANQAKKFTLYTRPARTHKMRPSYRSSWESHAKTRTISLPRRPLKLDP